MDSKENVEELTCLLDGAEEDIKDNAGKRVEIEHCINIKTLSDFKVSCSYRDIVYMICILKEYLKLIEEKRVSLGNITENNSQNWRIDSPSKLSMTMTSRWRHA